MRDCFNQNSRIMDLQILVSKKGTQVVTASNLHDALRLPQHKYNSNIAKWLTDIYNFNGDIRKPIELKDYSKRNLKLSKRKDFYLSIELAKLITLNSDSNAKQQYAKWLTTLEHKEDTIGFFSKDQIVAVLELTKAMGLISCQKSVEQHHLQAYEETYGRPYRWWEYRANLLGYSVEELKSKMRQVGKSYKGKNILQMLMTVDKYEIIRMAVIDLFLALGKTIEYAKSMGDLAKFFATELKVEIWDDRKSSINFMTHKVNPQLVEEVKMMKKGKNLPMWLNKAI